MCKHTNWFKDIKTGEWVHIVVVVKDNSEKIIYIDGALKYKQGL